MFIDQAQIRVEGGQGGHGCISFRREKFVAKGGPDGGDGGNGGDVIISADANKQTLLDFRYRHVYKAGRGAHGRGQNKHGKRGQDVVIRVPCGTLIFDVETRICLADLVRHGQSLVVAGGGQGGRGNAHFSSSTRQTPQEAEDGQPGMARTLNLELKLLADVGLVGHPNAGKSTLLARLSAAHPKIADYPFTTLQPNLGIVPIDPYESFVLADIPGLIEGAHEGKGLGDQFLRHIERTRLLVYLLDVTNPSPWHDYDVLRRELQAYNPELVRRPELIAMNKIDVLAGQDRLAELRQARAISFYPLSAVTGTGVQALIYAIKERLVER